MIEIKNKEEKNNNNKIGEFFGVIFSFNSTLKLHHWHITGTGSYARHMALDQALDELLETTDSLVETAYAMNGDITIVIPETKNTNDIIDYCERMYDFVNDKGRSLLTEQFQQSLFDDYTQAIQQLLYRLKRLQ